MAKGTNEREIRYEMRIALYWRGLIGDSEYVKFDPDDMVRWYEALELRGPDEIRTLRNERYRTIQTGGMQGIVSQAPHPPVWLVNQWLEKDDQKVHTLEYWGLSCAFLVASMLFFGNLQGCASLTPMNPLYLNPPASSASVTPYTNTMQYGIGTQYQGLGAIGPNTSEAPVNQTVTGPQSNGIAGAATGAVAPTGATGAQNIGASAGVAQSSGSSTQP